MIYSNFNGEKISTLGMGCMRFPVVDGNYAVVDIPATERLIDTAIAGGINYFDTAWVYHNETSESILGEILQKYPRKCFNLATKFPGFDLSYMNRVQQIFETQLERCRVDYFDFYLFHSVSEGNINEYLDPKFGILDYLLEQKKNGRIRHLGFSAHGAIPTMKRFLEAYGEHMEFCQIQLNWLDWKLQNAKAKVELLKEYNIPIWVMEPVRGGRLISLESEYIEALNEARPGVSTAEWAFRFLQSIDGVAVTLSGMSNYEQLTENIKTFSENKPLSDSEMKLLLGIADKMMEKTSLPCTGCQYCTSHCPMELDIPTIIGHYNEYNYSKSGGRAPMAIKSLDEQKRPSACIGCRACEAVCPQQIKISKMMQDFSEKLAK